MFNRKKFISLATALLVALSAFVPATADEVYAASKVQNYNGHYYLYVGEVVDAGTAELTADLKGGHLVTVNSKAEQEFLLENVIPENSGDIWLGAKKNSKGKWKWVTGEKFKALTWFDGEPSNGDSENYIRMENGLWDDCTITENSWAEGCCYVIEWDSKSEYNAYKNKKTAAKIKNIEGKTTYKGHSYKYYEVSTTWKQASKYCKKLGGYLATITSTGENNKVYKLTGGSNAWFGLSDAKVEGIYKWVTNERTDFLKFSEEVNNAYAGEEDYFGFFKGKQWNDYRNDDEAVVGFICEWDSSDDTILTAVNKTVTLKKGQSYNLKYQIYPVKEKVSFKNADKSVATVTSKGIVKAKKKGTTKITIKSGKEKVTVTIKVK